MKSLREIRLAHKRAREKEVVGIMIGMYCHHWHGTRRGELCPDCWALLDYARSRVDSCPNMEKKSYCSVCSTHCYNPDKRDQIRAIMRWAGPRMMLSHPFMALRHLFEEHRARRRKR